LHISKTRTQSFSTKTVTHATNLLKSFLNSGLPSSLLLLPQKKQKKLFSDEHFRNTILKNRLRISAGQKVMKYSHSYVDIHNLSETKVQKKPSWLLKIRL